MRIIVHKTFTYQKSATKTAKLYPGEYEVDKHVSLHVAELVLRFGDAHVLPEPKPVKKVAPENKVVEVAESKATVEVKPVRRRSTRAKSDK